MRRSAVILAMLGMGAVAAGCGPAKKSAAPVRPAPYVLGMVASESGVYASLGVPEVASARLAVREINRGGGIGGHPLVIRVLDSQSSSGEAAKDFAQLIQEDRVLGLIGDSSTQGTMAALRLVTDARIPLISLASAKEIIQPAAERRWIFKVPPVDTLPMRTILSYVKAKGFSRVAFLYMNAEYGTAGWRDFQPLARREGLSVVFSSAFSPTATTVLPELTRLKAANPAPQAVIVWSIPPVGDTVINDYRQLKLPWPVLFSDGMSNQAFIALAPHAVNGAMLASTKLLVADQLPASDPQKAVIQHYVRAYDAGYEASTKAPANMFGGFGYDAVELFAKAIARAGSAPSPRGVRDALEHLDYAGVTGHMVLSPEDHNGLTPDSEVLIRVEKNAWRWLPKYHG